MNPIRCPNCPHLVHGRASCPTPGCTCQSSAVPTPAEQPERHTCGYTHEPSLPCVVFEQPAAEAEVTCEDCLQFGSLDSYSKGDLYHFIHGLQEQEDDATDDEATVKPIRHALTFVYL